MRFRWAIPSFLPAGGQLPAAVWRTRHSGILTLLWAHAALIPLFGLWRGYSVVHVAAESCLVPAAALVGSLGDQPQRVRTGAVSLGLLLSSGILVHLSGGVIEMHFHFFVMVAVVALYQDWLPFLAAVGFVFVHHGLMGAIAADSVYNHEAARQNPWLWAGIHAAFISAISAVCLVTWRLNENTLGEQRRAEENLRRETSIVESLHAVGRTLAGELDTQRVVQTVTDATTELTGAAFGAFFYNVENEAGESFLLYTLSGAPIEAFARFGLPRNTEIFAPTFNGEGVVRLDDVTKDPRFGKMAPHHGMPKGHLPVCSYLAVPVRSRNGAAIGGLFFGHPEPARFSELDERVVVGIASQASVALDNARLYESERAARAAAEQARDALTLLASASRVLTSSLELDVILRDFATLLVPDVADCCAVDLMQDDQTFQRIAVVANGNACTQVDVEGHLRRMDTPEHPVVVAMTTGLTQVVGQISEALTPATGRGDDTVRQRVLAQAPTSAVVAPLIGRGGILGTVSLAGSNAAGRPLDGQDVPFVEELARRAAIAVENARLYGRQRTVAETLQHSLLPERLPEIPGVAAAARYLAGADVEVGGDWYDVLTLSRGRLALTMGDVVGRGEGAASLMGQLRNAARAYARDGRSPRELVSRLNALLLETGPEQMATMVYAVLDQETSELHLVNAGHPPPLLLHADGTTTYIEVGRGMPIGVSITGRYDEATVSVRPGDTLVLYTDGLVEDRAEPLQLGLDRLERSVRAGPVEPDALCDHVLREMSEGRLAQDDTALLVVRIEALGDHLHLQLPAQPAVLVPLRAVLRRWLVGAGASEAECFELLVAVVEASSNAIRHAHGPQALHFELDARADDGRVEISVQDFGSWRAPRVGEGGRGLSMIDDFVDELEITRGDSGTHVCMRRRLAKDAVWAGS